MRSQREAWLCERHWSNNILPFDWFMSAELAKGRRDCSAPLAMTALSNFTAKLAEDAEGVVPIFDSNLILSKSPAQPMQAYAHATGYGLVPKRQRPTCEQTSTRNRAGKPWLGRGISAVKPT